MAQVISQPGQSLGSGDDDALFLKVFGGEVLVAFDQANLFMPRTRVRTITSGESAVFPAVGKAGVKSHQPGESLILDQDGGSTDYLSKIKVAEKRIFVDDPMISGTFVARIDELKNHWDARSAFSTELGRALAREADRHILSTIAAAAATANENIPGETGTGITLSGTWTSAKTASHLVGFAFEAAEDMDERNVPPEDRVLAVRPKGYYALAQYTTLLDKDFNSANGGIDAGRVLRVAGMEIVKTNSFKASNDSAVVDYGVRNDVHGGSGDGYNMDWTTLGAVAFQKGAIGTVKLLDLGMEMEYQVERQGWLLVAKYVMGHNILRPECAARMTVTAADF